MFKIFLIKFLDIADLEAAIKKLEITVNGKSSAPEPHLAVCPAKPASAAADDDDDLDLFGADSEVSSTLIIIHINMKNNVL